MRSSKLLCSVLLLATVGCVMADPGGQVRRSLSQSKIYEWREDGGFWVEGNGPQTESFTMVQGDLKMLTDEDGIVTGVDWANSKIAYYLAANPSAKDAASTMGQALIASTEQVKAVSASFDNMIELLGTRFGGSGVTEAGEAGGGNDLMDMIRNLIEEELRKRTGGTGNTPPG